MSEMGERMANAILEDLKDRRGIRQAFDAIEDDDEVMAEIREAIGRAAIMALRQPTPKMIEAGQDGISGWDANAELIFQQMIDEALK
jgi:hypothetical protein